MTGNSPDTPGPLPSQPRNAGFSVGEAQRLALIAAQSLGHGNPQSLIESADEIADWLAGGSSSDGAAGRSATDGAAPASAAPEATSSSIRERAFDAAQRLVLSQPSMVIGQMEQRRQADFILDLAQRFESWMTRPAAAPDSAKPDSAEMHCGEPDSGDPAIDAYIESDRRVMAMMEKLKPIDGHTLVRSIADVARRVDEIVAAANRENLVMQGRDRQS